MATHVHLIGFMGAGKTTVGRRLAADLGWGFCDLDRAVELGAGTSVAEIFRLEGEDGFRTRERRAAEANDPAVDLVVATGGGFPVDPANLGLMRRRGPIVWLDLPFEAAWRRISEAAPVRPLAADRGSCRRLYATRRTAYAAGDLRVPCADREATEIAAEIAKWLRDRRPG